MLGSTSSPTLKHYFSQKNKGKAQQPSQSIHPRSSEDDQLALAKELSLQEYHVAQQKEIQRYAQSSSSAVLANDNYHRHPGFPEDVDDADWFQADTLHIPERNSRKHGTIAAIQPPAKKARQRSPPSITKKDKGKQKAAKQSNMAISAYAGHDLTTNSLASPPPASCSPSSPFHDAAVSLKKEKHASDDEDALVIEDMDLFLQQLGSSPPTSKSTTAKPSAPIAQASLTPQHRIMPYPFSFSTPPKAPPTAAGQDDLDEEADDYIHRIRTRTTRNPSAKSPTISHSHLARTHLDNYVTTNLGLASHETKFTRTSISPSLQQNPRQTRLKSTVSVPDRINVEDEADDDAPVSPSRNVPLDSYEHQFDDPMVATPLEEVTYGCVDDGLSIGSNDILILDSPIVSSSPTNADSSMTDNDHGDAHSVYSIGDDDDDGSVVDLCQGLTNSQIDTRPQLDYADVDAFFGFSPAPDRQAQDSYHDPVNFFSDDDDLPAPQDQLSPISPNSTTRARTLLAQDPIGIFLSDDDDISHDLPLRQPPSSIPSASPRSTLRYLHTPQASTTIDVMPSTFSSTPTQPSRTFGRQSLDSLSPLQGFISLLGDPTLPRNPRFKGYFDQLKTPTAASSSGDSAGSRAGPRAGARIGVRKRGSSKRSTSFRRR
ncbi:hypothetical protein DM01DRAFT_1338954, partial [Hesseltinella vesiculosa]